MTKTTTKTATRTIYSATAISDGRPAGHICYGATREACDKKARRFYGGSLKVKRITVDEPMAARLAELGKL